MRIIIVDPQKTMTCGICEAQKSWIHTIQVRGAHGLYCMKCDTLTVFEPVHSKYMYEALKEEVLKVRDQVLTK